MRRAVVVIVTTAVAAAGLAALPGDGGTDRGTTPRATGARVDTAQAARRPGRLVVQVRTIPKDPLRPRVRFSFGTTAPSGAFVRGDRIFHVERVPAGTYRVTLQGNPGWRLQRVRCDDRNSTERLAAATATARVASGETVRCRFTVVRDPASDPLVAAAGDISCDSASPNYNGSNGTRNSCRMRATSDQILARSPAAVLPLGDVQYEEGRLEQFTTSYEQTWGRLKGITRPAVGNHEYLTNGAAGYFDYFGAAAGNRDEGWYAFDVGSWRLIALNSNCGKAGGCGPGSRQLDWLTRELAANPRRCTLAYWHHPRFSSGQHGNIAETGPLFSALHAAGADLVLAGHDHMYERFAHLAPDGRPDPDRGIREFVVGTGGRNLTKIASVQPGSEVRDDTSYGVLFLDLRPGSYRWSFESPAPGGVRDAGDEPCH